MASLCIKDGEADDLAQWLATERGLTKSVAVKPALSRELQRRDVDTRPTRERMLDSWRRFPVPETLGPAPDKAFWDELSGEP